MGGSLPMSATAAAAAAAAAATATATGTAAAWHPHQSGVTDADPALPHQCVISTGGKPVSSRSELTTCSRSLNEAQGLGPFKLACFKRLYLCLYLQLLTNTSDNTDAWYAK